MVNRRSKWLKRSEQEPKAKHGRVRALEPDRWLQNQEMPWHAKWYSHRLCRQRHTQRVRPPSVYPDCVVGMCSASPVDKDGSQQKSSRTKLEVKPQAAKLFMRYCLAVTKATFEYV